MERISTTASSSHHHTKGLLLKGCWCIDPGPWPKVQASDPSRVQQRHLVGPYVWGEEEEGILKFFLELDVEMPVEAASV